MLQDEQANAANVVNVTQEGNNNLQSGSYNSALTYQYGADGLAENNIAKINQADTASYSTAVITQAGAANNATSNQNGFGDYAKPSRSAPLRQPFHHHPQTGTGSALYNNQALAT